MSGGQTGERLHEKETENDPNIHQNYQREELLNPDKDNDTEDEDAYRLRVYGYVEGGKESAAISSSSSSRPLIRNQYAITRGSLRKLSKRLSKRFSHSLIRRRSSFAESLPDSPKGWMVLSCVTMSAILAYEVRLQKSLTKPPITFCQLASGSKLERIFKELTEQISHGHNKHSPATTGTKILSRSIQPSLFIGTRGMVSSSAAYFSGGPSESSRMDYLRFREILTMSQDGAQLAIDWEIQLKTQGEAESDDQTAKQNILSGIIRHPVVIILHGINNDSSFGYMKSLSRSFCNRGYVSASMNFRGCGGIPLSTSRGYNAAYTGDLRSVVRQISARLDKGVSIFLVGNSLGANIMTKYLGEEGMFGTLPSCVSGAASLGNPLLIDSKIVKFPFNILMALGVKKIFLQNFKSICGLNDANSKEIIKKGFLAQTISKVDDAMAPMMIRNSPRFPFETKIGYENGEAYWFDASSYRCIRHISVPFLNITAQDDFLVSRPSRNKLGFCLANPNVLIVETRCGGHLGWQETPPDSAFGASSWADTAASDFFDAVLRVGIDESLTKASFNQSNQNSADASGRAKPHNLKMDSMYKQLKEVKSEALALTTSNISRL